MSRLPPAPGLLRVALLALLATGAVPGAQAADDALLEPIPPAIFFREPDPQVAEEIDYLVSGFADLNKAISIRNALVRRYRLWSVPHLARVLAAEKVEAQTWNACLTLSVLRDELGPAPELWVALPPLLDLARGSAEPYRRCFAVLALGSFHGPVTVAPPPARRDPLRVGEPEREAQRLLGDGIYAMGAALDHGHPSVRVAGALALAKTGGPLARAQLRPRERLQAGDAVTEPIQAQLLATGLLPEDDDEALFVTMLGHVERRVRRAAALGAALQALSDEPPAWTVAPHAVLRALSNHPVTSDKEDGFEAVFARGVLAATGSAPATTWRDIFDVAVTPSSGAGAALAAAQALLFCEEPWFLEQALARVRGPVSLKDPVLAAFLLRLGASGSAEGIEACALWLKSPARSPRGRSDWDARYHAAIGIVRAFAGGRVRAREAALDALEAGVKRGMPDGGVRSALAHLLEAEGRALAQDPGYRMRSEHVRTFERSFRDPHGLLAPDLGSVAVQRLEDMVPLVFNVTPLRNTPGSPDRTQIPQRFLKGCLDAWPYFSRRDLLRGRGVRPAAAMPQAGDPRLEVRR